MQIIHGGGAFSAFYLDKTLSAARRVCPRVTAVVAEYAHFLDVAPPLSGELLERARRLLEYGEASDGAGRGDKRSAEHNDKRSTEHNEEWGEKHGEPRDARARRDDTAATTLLVIPRPGTISPWSSKATDIFHACGLRATRRVERGVCWRIDGDLAAMTESQHRQLAALLHDRMTQIALAGPTARDAADRDTLRNDLDYAALQAAARLFAHTAARPLRHIALSDTGVAALRQANADLGLALSAAEMDYLSRVFRDLGRDPSDAELMMFAQANSEHCRHKTFNARWIIDGETKERSLFAMIKQTHRAHPGRVLSAYRDNAAVIRGYRAARFFPDPATRRYDCRPEAAHLLMKVETHNHPTAISPYPGAATGVGGEIRDEAATGIGGKPKAGLCGFAVSNLRLPQSPQPWEQEQERQEERSEKKSPVTQTKGAPSKDAATTDANHHSPPDHIASPLQIMLDAPLGAAAYNNEFGRPLLGGFFRVFEARVNGRWRGYHKPIMLAGGYGVVRDGHVHKRAIAVGSPIALLGGPAMLIGLGGGAASSLAAGSGDRELDFASVQRDNAEMQRRCQEVIDRCWALGEGNPILSLHDVGAGGLSNAVPELAHAAGRGAAIDLGAIPSADPSLSPLELWCNEAQERYALAVAAERLDAFAALCKRERTPFAVIGHATEERRLLARDGERTVIDMPLSALLGEAPRLTMTVAGEAAPAAPDTQAAAASRADDIDLNEALTRLLQLPTIADKRFLITIADRSVSGLVCRDQMVGPWQTPVADCAVTAGGFEGYTGEAAALGERAPLAVLNPAASGRMALAEAVANICAARILRLDDIALSANWMAALDETEDGDREARALFDTVAALSACAAELGLAIPVGKDSLSMQTRWRENGVEHRVSAPLSVVVTAFAPVADIRRGLTPQLQDEPESVLLLIDLGRGRQRLGGSALVQVYNRHGGDGWDTAPDLDDSALLRAFFNGIQLLNETGHLLAYHDRSDGGLLIALCEMAFAARLGVDVDAPAAADPVAFLCNEEAGAVAQIRRDDLPVVMAALQDAGLPSDCLRTVARLNPHRRARVFHDGKLILDRELAELHGLWSSVSFHMQSLRDNPHCAAEEYAAAQDMSDPGLSLTASFAPAPAAIIGKAKPRIGILREQGVNGQTEMAAAFARAGFDCMDIHLSDIQSGGQTLAGLRGLAVCGGFSYGDVLGAGGGWAKSILFNPALRERFAAFFHRPDAFVLGVCNGCQMLSGLRELIPGADDWPRFVPNRSGRFESRLVMVEILPSPSVLLRDMQGAQLPVVVAHGEGRARFAAGAPAAASVLRYVDNHGAAASAYPANPNGSAGGATGFCNEDGRVTIMMPHPERVFLSRQFSWLPPDWRHEESPWMRLFHNARRWVG